MEKIKIKRFINKLLHKTKEFFRRVGKKKQERKKQERNEVYQKIE